VARSSSVDDYSCTARSEEMVVFSTPARLLISGGSLGKARLYVSGVSLSRARSISSVDSEIRLALGLVGVYWVLARLDI